MVQRRLSGAQKKALMAQSYSQSQTKNQQIASRQPEYLARKQASQDNYLYKQDPGRIRPTNSVNDQYSQNFGATSFAHRSSLPGEMSGQAKLNKYKAIAPRSRRGGMRQSGPVPLSSYGSPYRTPADQVQLVGNLHGQDSVRYSSENPDMAQNLQSEILSGNAQAPGSFASEFNGMFDPEGGMTMADNYQPSARGEVASGLRQYDESTFSPSMKANLTAKNTQDYGGSGFTFKGIDGMLEGINGPLGGAQRDRTIRSTENAEVDDYFNGNVATGYIETRYDKFGNPSFMGSFGDSGVDNVYKQKMLLQSQFSRLKSPTEEQRRQFELAREQLDDEIGFAQQDAIKNIGGEQGLAFDQELGNNRIARNEALTRNDQDQLAASSSAGKFDTNGVNQDSRIDAMEKQGLDKLKKNIEQQKASFQNQFDQQSNQAEQARMAKEELLNSSFDDQLEQQLGNNSERFTTDAFGELTPGGRAMRAKIIGQVEERRRTALLGLQTEASALMSQLSVDYNDKLMGLDTQVSDADMAFLTNRITRVSAREEKALAAAEKEAAANTKFENDKGLKMLGFENSRGLKLMDIQGNKEQALYKAELKEAFEGQFDRNSFSDALMDISKTTDPDVAKTMVANLTQQLSEAGMDTDLDSLYQSIYSKREQQDLENRYTQSQISDKQASANKKNNPKSTKSTKETESASDRNSAAISAQHTNENLKAAAKSKELRDEMGLTALQIANALSYNKTNGITDPAKEEKVSWWGRASSALSGLGSESDADPVGETGDVQDLIDQMK